jgi:hypothetical protein
MPRLRIHFKWDDAPAKPNQELCESFLTRLQTCVGDQGSFVIGHWKRVPELHKIQLNQLHQVRSRSKSAGGVHSLKMNLRNQMNWMIHSHPMSQTTQTVLVTPAASSDQVNNKTTVCRKSFRLLFTGRSCVNICVAFRKMNARKTRHLGFILQRLT